MTRDRYNDNVIYPDKSFDKLKNRISNRQR